MWIKLKRFLLFIIGIVTTILAMGCIASAILGYYGDHVGLNSGLVILGLALAALGIFFIRIGIRGTNEQVRDADLL